MERIIFHNAIYLSLLLLVCSCISNNSDGTGNEVVMPERGLCAHRGAMDTHPENTLPALEEAVRLGAHMIEFDLQLTKDMIPILMHDTTVDRTTNGKGKVKDVTLVQIKELDCGSWKSKNFSNLKVPTFQEALNVLPKNIWLNIHLKGGEQLGRIAARIILDLQRQHQSIFACDSSAFKGIMNISGSLITCNMDRQGDRENYIKNTIRKKHKFIQLLKRRNNYNLQSHINSLHEKKIKINYYGTDSETEIRDLFNLGIDFILVNNLSKSIRIAENIGLAPRN